MNNQYDIGSYTPVVGFCISEKLGVYIANHSIVGFKRHFMNGTDIITMYTPNQNHIIYEHLVYDLDFIVIAKKIIMRIIDSLRYDINTNINIDKIVEEVIENGKEALTVNN